MNEEYENQMKLDMKHQIKTGQYQFKSASPSPIKINDTDSASSGIILDNKPIDIKQSMF